MVELFHIYKGTREDCGSLGCFEFEVVTKLERELFIKCGRDCSKAVDFDLLCIRIFSF